MMKTLVVGASEATRELLVEQLLKSRLIFLGFGFLKKHSGCKLLCEI